MPKPIPHIDLWPGNRPLRQGFLSEISALYRKGAFSGGPYVERFERDFAAYLGAPHCVGVNSGTSAIHLALLALGVGPGDEVVVPAYTFAGTVWGVLYCGAVPVFADVDPETGNLTAETAARVIGKRTRAIIVVHLFGRAAPMTELKRLARRRRIRLIEDAAQAHGGAHAEGSLGTLGDLGCFSFYPTKNLGACGEGGAVVTANRRWADRIRLLRNHNAAERYVHLGLGFNYRMEGIQGLFLSRKLKRLDAMNRERSAIAAVYLEAIGAGPIRPLCGRVEDSAWHAFVCRVPGRARFIKRLEAEGIGHAIYYPRILPELPAFRAYVRDPAAVHAAFPGARSLSRQSVSLPLYPGLRKSDIARVAAVLRDWR